MSPKRPSSSSSAPRRSIRPKGEDPPNVLPSSSAPRRSMRHKEEDLENYKDIDDPPEFPNVQLMQSLTTPINSDNPAFAEHRKLTVLVLTHLACSEVAKNHITTILHDIAPKHASNTVVVLADDIVTFLKDNTPRIIFKKLAPREGREVVWGQVRKGNEPRAKENELFISLELANVLCPVDPPPNLKSDKIRVQALRQMHRLLYCMVLMHELIHAIIKHFFGSQFMTPLLDWPRYQMVPDGKGNGEAGWSFELRHLGFQLEVLLEKKDFNLADRLWRISHLVATHLPGVSQSCILDTKNIEKLVSSFKKVWPLEIRSSMLHPVPINMNADTHVRCWTGSAVPAAFKFEDLDISFEVPEELCFVMTDELVATFTCSRGLGI
ncbi:hypothetical protein GGX14DRAFT_459622 [Mycena pura]|uniref:Uncharacterized protein n=1 Tax=Mycena pura TaxID=153505 RepID=A0AAD6VEE3_9AGAR|nr:hypothetical protein GGX14DRAFT_459622 [Mycena pura]